MADIIPQQLSDLLDWPKSIPPLGSMRRDIGNTAYESITRTNMLHAIDDLGLKGDGTTDDYPAMQAALDTIGDSRTIYMPPDRRYLFSGNIATRSHLQCIYSSGYGADIVTGGIDIQHHSCIMDGLNLIGAGSLGFRLRPNDTTVAPIKQTLRSSELRNSSRNSFVAFWGHSTKKLYCGRSNDRDRYPVLR